MTPDWICPGCGLLCDDITLSDAPQNQAAAMESTPASCPRAVDWRDSVTLPPPPLGSTLPAVDLEARLQTCAQLVATFRAPCIWLADCDVATTRLALDLAATLHATVMLDQSPESIAIDRIVQRAGHFTGTFGEIRSRADRLILVGHDLDTIAPRLRPRLQPPTGGDSRCVSSTTAIARRWIRFGDDSPSTDSTSIPCSATDLPEALDRYHARLTGTRLHPRAPDAIDLIVDRLASACDEARSIAWIWHDAGLGPRAPEVARSLLRVVDQQNNRTRAVSIRFVARPGLSTAAQVCAWRCGFNPPLAYTDQGAQPLDRWHIDDCDGVIAIGSLGSPRYLPTGLPVVHFVPAAQTHSYENALPLEVPALDVSGYVQRSDQAMMHRLSPLRPTREPIASNWLDRFTRIVAARR